MATHDPISDLITRIRNAQLRSKSKVSSPGSKIRQSVLEVLKAEGYIRGYATVEHSSGRNELEIELKYFDGEPVIREIERVSKPARTGSPSSTASSGCRSPDGGSTRPSRTCRGSTTVSAFRCCRRRRESWPTTTRAMRMWAARSSLRCSEEGIFSDVTHWQ